MTCQGHPRCPEPAAWSAWHRLHLCPLHLANADEYERTGNPFADDHLLDAERARPLAGQVAVPW